MLRLNEACMITFALCGLSHNRLALRPWLGAGGKEIKSMRCRRFSMLQHHERAAQRQFIISFSKFGGILRNRLHRVPKLRDMGERYSMHYAAMYSAVPYVR